MANNRMFLVNTRTGEKIKIAKYYPSTGWYCGETLAKRLGDWFHQQDFGDGQLGCSAGGMWGAEYVLELEIEDD